MLRHVDVYANGHCLQYDRDHWIDNFGLLAEARHSFGAQPQQRWVIDEISAPEFVTVWDNLTIGSKLALELQCVIYCAGR